MSRIPKRSKRLESLFGTFFMSLLRRGFSKKRLQSFRSFRKRCFSDASRDTSSDSTAEMIAVCMAQLLNDGRSSRWGCRGVAVRFGPLEGLETPHFSWAFGGLGT